MTAVVAVEHPGGVMVGCDAFQGSEAWRDRGTKPKWFKLGPYLLVGYAGSLRPIQVARGALKAAPRKAGESAETDEPPSYIVAYDGVAYMVDEDYALIRSAHGVASIGAGEDIAYGAIAAARKLRPEMDPREQVRFALALAAEHRNFVCEPFRTTDVKRPPRR